MTVELREQRIRADRPRSQENVVNEDALDEEERVHCDGLRTRLMEAPETRGLETGGA